MLICESLLQGRTAQAYIPSSASCAPTTQDPSLAAPPFMIVSVRKAIVDKLLVSARSVLLENTRTRWDQTAALRVHTDQQRCSTLRKNFRDVYVCQDFMARMHQNAGRAFRTRISLHSNLEIATIVPRTRTVHCGLSTPPGVKISFMLR